jgi:hypothetical protein
MLTAARTTSRSASAKCRQPEECAAYLAHAGMHHPSLSGKCSSSTRLRAILAGNVGCNLPRRHSVRVEQRKGPADWPNAGPGGRGLSTHPPLNPVRH